VFQLTKGLEYLWHKIVIGNFFMSQYPFEKLLYRGT
jgi:hypothetical protein